MSYVTQISEILWSKSRYAIQIGENGGWLCELQPSEYASVIKEWKDNNFQVKKISAAKAEELSKKYTLHHLSSGAYTVSGGSEAYIPHEEV